MPWRGRWFVAACFLGCTASSIGASARLGDPGADPGAGQPVGDAAADADADADADVDELDSAADGGGAPPDAAVEVPEPEPPLHVAVISDLNDSYGSTTYSRAVHDAVDRIVELDPDVVLCTGDMVAGQQAGLDYGAMWDGFHEAVTGPLTDAGIPLAVTPGNHDASGYPAFEGEREIYVDEWSARRPAVTFRDDSGYPLHYSFSVGPALFTSIDDTVVAPLDPDQHDWLDRELEAGADFPVKIVFGHIPIHPFTQGRETEILDDEDLEQTLANRGVTLFLSGHHHGYFPGRHAGLRQVSMAALGSGSRRLLGVESVSQLAFAWIEIVDGAVTTLEAYAAPDFNEPIARSSLPQSVGVVARDDR
ncbi:MAG: metallophosphoesterase [Deltaproteobacteria bacterium]|nr:metallophosphoesterase [Deltaproteobacteria bacterium]